MRRLIALLFIVLLGVVGLNFWRPGSTALAPAPTPTLTLLPANFTLIPTFAPDYPCALQNVQAHDDKLCRSESVAESIAAQGDGVVFIQHDYSMGAGCWGSIGYQIHELRVCSKSSGALTTLTKYLTSAVIPSPDGQWFAFAETVFNTSITPHLYRIRSDGSDVQRLDTKGFPEPVVGSAQVDGWSADGMWISVSGWDGLNGQYHDRIKADGSGAYAVGTHTTNTTTATYPPQPTAASPTSGAPVIGTPYPLPTMTLPPG